MLFIIPVLAQFVPNLDPLLWVGIAFGIIILYQQLFPGTEGRRGYDVGVGGGGGAGAGGPGGGRGGNVEMFQGQGRRLGDRPHAE